MGCENSYQIKILSKQLNNRIRTFSHHAKNVNVNVKMNTLLNPWFVTGFFDAEASFHISINENKKYDLGWSVYSKFQIGLHKRDLPLLLQLQQFFCGVGQINIDSINERANFSITKISDLNNIIIPHFNEYPLQTQKTADFMLFKKAINIMLNKGHLSIEGLHRIINIKASMNLGLNDKLKSEFSNNFPVERLKFLIDNIPNPNWISGFVSGEGNFDVKIQKSKSHKIGYQVLLRFRISQHDKDIELMEILIKFLGTGQIEKDPRNSVVTLVITKFSNINNIIIPFFEKYPIQGVKQLDFLDWCKVCKLMNEGQHKKSEGLDLIRLIKTGMNTGRKFSDK